MPANDEGPDPNVQPPENSSSRQSRQDDSTSAGDTRTDCERWKAAYRAVIIRRAKRTTFVTADDADDDMRGWEPCHCNQRGTIFAELAREGVLKDTGQTVRSRRRLRHGNILRVWRLRHDVETAA